MILFNSLKVVRCVVLLEKNQTLNSPELLVLIQLVFYSDTDPINFLDNFNSRSDQRLDKTEALFVDVYHTTETS
jgi:hypothetical protein